MAESILNCSLLVVVAVLMGSCAGFRNEGAMTVRSSNPEYDAKPSNFDVLYYDPRTLVDENGRSKAGSGVIGAGDYFSISLLSAHICTFRELGISDFSIGNLTNPNATSSPNVSTQGCTDGVDIKGSSGRNTRGEIAIVVNAGEGIKNAFSPSDEESVGRIVYYNEDIRKSGQMINARNIPIYGPQEYKGDNVTFDLWMLELDNDENSKMTQLLQSLSSLGQAAYPPSAPALKVLNNLGSAFLSDNQDDLQARINIRFDMLPPADSKVARLPLKEGYYAFVREENRDRNPEWGKFLVNPEMGELCSSEKVGVCDTGPHNTYRERTWFLIRIAKETAESALKFEGQETLSAFTNRMATFKEEDLKKTTTIMQALTDDLNEVACKSTEVKGPEGRINEEATSLKRSRLELKCNGK